MSYRFHVIGLPNTIVSKEWSNCAYTQKVLKFVTMMRSLGHEVYLYSAEGAETNANEQITCITKNEQDFMIGIKKPEDNLKAEFNPEKPYWKRMNQRVIENLKSRIKPKDFICVIAGRCQKEIADAFPQNLTVEFGIGYDGVFSNYKVFESYTWQNAVYGAQSGASGANGNFYDAVIPNYYDPRDFPYSEKKEDYFLFIGRLTERKGYQIAVDVCKKLKARLIIAGQGTPPEYGEYVGTVGPEKRGELMAYAKAVFVPTLYLEPFGGVSIEALFCGTPIITTDWGCFTENNIHGKTGYRCRTMAQFEWAARNVDKIKPADCRTFAMNFSMDKVKLMYQAYFDQLYGLWDGGFYNTKQVSQMNWLNKNYAFT